MSNLNEGVKVQVRIEGSYTNGHSYDRVAVVDAPDPIDGPDEIWWWDVVFRETGDGVTDPKVGSYTKATVFAGNWDGATYEWND